MINSALFFLSLTTIVSAASIPSHDALHHDLKPRASCENTATSRDCWGDYSIDTDYYSVTPDTGVTREYWLNVEEGPCSPDGVEVSNCMTFNGTIPGPAIIADWGDTLKVHVYNNLSTNGTSIHWHGLRQLYTSQMDGVPGVSQCPIAPGESMTYEFRVMQYGSTWYHSHFSLQYGEGLFGPLVLNGPATADYDEDLGVLFLQDWSHTPAFELWDTAKQGGQPQMENGLVNGTNTYNSSGTVTGKKFEATFESGKKYLIRVVNVAVEGHFDFSIDGHNLTVIANDLVPIVPYTTDSVLISIGQRYDIIVEANAEADNYWLRAGWQTVCATNGNPTGMTGIIRYDSSSTADPTTTGNTISTYCGDEPLESLVPYLKEDVGTIVSSDEEDLYFSFGSYFTWTLNSSSFYIDYTKPTLDYVFDNDTDFPADYNVVKVEASSSNASEWNLMVITDETGFGIYHPIHLHGHDFWIVGAEAATFDMDTFKPNTTNPPRRDTAVLPANGYLALAFKLDNPGAWVAHCHIAWHASEGFSMEFVETERDITTTLGSSANTLIDDTCNTYNTYNKTAVFLQDDSGI